MEIYCFVILPSTTLSFGSRADLSVGENREVVSLSARLMSLIAHLQTIRGSRTQPTDPLWVVLLLVVMGTMSGCTGYRPLADFVARHQTALLSVLE